jgi:hypothetical protein
MLHSMKPSSGFSSQRYCPSLPLLFNLRLNSKFPVFPIVTIKRRCRKWHVGGSDPEVDWPSRRNRSSSLLPPGSLIEIPIDSRPQKKTAGNQSGADLLKPL